MPYSDCFYYDAGSGETYRLVEWLNAVGWASEYSAGSEHPGICHQFPPGYFVKLWRILSTLIHQPNLN